MFSLYLFPLLFSCKGNKKVGSEIKNGTMGIFVYVYLYLLNELNKNGERIVHCERFLKKERKKERKLLRLIF